MEASGNKRSVLFETFVLLSHDAAATAAHAVNQRTWELLRAAREPGNGTAQLGIPLVEALDGLREAARSDLATGRATRAR